MSVDASLPLQLAIIRTLKAAPALAAIVAGRVYHNAPPANAAKPYVSLGPSQISPDLADEYEGQRERFQIDGWSSAPGPTEAKQMGAAIHDALQDADLAIDGHRCIDVQIEQTRYLVDADGVTQHAVLIFTATTEPVS